MQSFSAKIYKIGINPFVSLPEDVLNALFEQAHRSVDPIQVRGTLNGKKIVQALVKYHGAWRLYLNTQMRQDAGIPVGDDAIAEIEFDPEPRIVPIDPKFAYALSKTGKQKRPSKRLRRHCRRKFCGISTP